MKVRSLSELGRMLDEDYSWRIQEISSLKRISFSTQTMDAKALQRASIPIAYAHWEGFIKNSACSYTLYVSGQVKNSSELKGCFLGLMLKTKLDQISDSQKAFKLWHEGINLLEGLNRERPVLNLRERIDRVGNLSFDIFSEIVHLCGLDIGKYVTKQKFIDDILVHSRNNIAHGENHIPSVKEIQQSFDICIELLREFKTDIENNASLKLFLR